MGQRCRVSPGYEHVEIHQAWIDDPRLFVEHVGPRPSLQHEIDRIDNAKGYEPGNVHWATSTEQKLNRRNTIWLEHDGRRQCLTHWARELGLDPKTLHHRLYVLKQSLEVALSPERQPAGPARLTFEIDGVRYASLKELAAAVGIKYHTLYMRIRRGMSPEAAVAVG